MEGDVATKYVGVRIPLEVMDEIERKMAITGEKQSAVIVSLIERGLARPPLIEENAEMPGWYRLNHEREHHLGRVAEYRGTIRGLREELANATIAGEGE